MINLRTRLLVGYGYMAVLMLLTAGTAGFRFFTINEAVERILSEKFRSISTSITMMDSLQGQDELMNSILTEGRPLAAELAEVDDTFDEALTRARENTTIDGEIEVIEQIEQRFDVFVMIRDQVLDADLSEAVFQNFMTEVSPALTETRRSILYLIELNHDEIIRAEEQAQATALHMVGLLGVLITIAMISMIFLSRALQQKILVRLKDLSDVAEEILTGNHGRRFDASVNDELGVVASQLNAALDERDALQAEMRGRLNQQKQLVLGLLAESKSQILLFGLDGKLIASACETLDVDELAPIRAWLLERRKATVSAFRKAHEPVEITQEIDGNKLLFRLLAANGRRPVGWLVDVKSGEKSVQDEVES